MTITVQELQEWLDIHYPDAYEFPKLLSYWLNKYEAEILEAKRLSHQRYKDMISQVCDDHE